MRANIYSGETRLNEKPLTIEAASRLLIYLAKQEVPNLWIERLPSADSSQFKSKKDPE